jgi:hypothetical protein
VIQTSENYRESKHRKTREKRNQTSERREKRNQTSESTGEASNIGRHEEAEIKHRKTQQPNIGKPGKRKHRKTQENANIGKLRKTKLENLGLSGAVIVWG